MNALACWALALGLIAATTPVGAQTLASSPAPPPQTGTPSTADVAAATPTTVQPRARRGAPRVPGATPAVRLRLSGHVGFTNFTASDTFEAVLDKTGGAVFGGGVGVLLGRHLFVDVQVSRFSADGERVFVTNDLQVYPLGIPLTVTTMPIDISAGWRFAPGPVRPDPTVRRQGFRPVPFVGGGVGVLRYKETAEFAEAGDDVNDSFGSYHVLGGVELPFTPRFGASVDGLYRWVPDAIGEAGASAVFGENDLGGATIRVRAIVTF
jgi:hypothetical protein